MTDFEERRLSKVRITTGKLAELIGGTVSGDQDLEIRGIAPVHQAGPAELGFLAQRRYLKYVQTTRAGALLVAADLAEETSGIENRIVVEEAHAALPALIATFYPASEPERGIHPTAVLGNGVVLGESVTIGPYAVLDEEAVIGDRVRIGAHSVVGAGAIVGEDSVLHPHVVLYPNTRLGKRVILHSGARLGSDGFGYIPSSNGIEKVPQVGACDIGDDVEIGANSCVDRGSIGRTTIGQFTKLDNLVHLAHNVQVGKGVLMAAMTGVAGSVEIGDGVMTGGQSGVSGHVEVGAGAKLAAQTGVIGDLAPGQTYTGFPAREHRDFLKAHAQLYKLPNTVKKIRDMERRLAALEASQEDVQG